MSVVRMAATAVLLALALVARAPAANVAGPARLLVLRTDGVQLWFDVELARDEEARRRGLMGRTILPPRHGMWFDFGRTRTIAMWMKNTPLSLDMIFVRADGHVTGIHEHAVPYSLDVISAPEAARFVLELPAGSAARYALGPGDRALLFDVAVNRPQQVDGRAETVE